MRKPFALALTAALMFVSQGVMATGLSPWQFGMSKAEVASFDQFGPYKSFKNGDLETYSGLFDGRKQNVQFYFDERGLRRIGVFMYEGANADEGLSAWRTAFEAMERNYGRLEIAAPGVTAGSDPVSAEVLAKSVGANTKAAGKTNMAPLRQPDGMSVFGSFFRHEFGGQTYYVVAVYLDRAP